MNLYELEKHLVESGYARADVTFCGEGYAIHRFVNKADQTDRIHYLFSQRTKQAQPFREITNMADIKQISAKVEWNAEHLIEVMAEHYHLKLTEEQAASLFSTVKPTFERDVIVAGRGILVALAIGEKLKRCQRPGCQHAVDVMAFNGDAGLPIGDPAGLTYCRECVERFDYAVCSACEKYWLRTNMYQAEPNWGEPALMCETCAVRDWEGW